MKRKYIWLIPAVVTAALLVLVIFAKSEKQSINTPDNHLTAAVTLRDVHGLAVDGSDSSKLWLANHSGLYMLLEDKDLFAVGSERADYMGFSAHPTESQTFFTSGHPIGGGNLGIQKTTDGGRTWQKLSDGVNGPVDFHTMAVNQTDPAIIYGSYAGQLQRSRDGGKNWQLVDDAPQALALATDPTDKETLFAATQAGLQRSTDQGETWTSTALMDAVYAVAVNPSNNQELLASSGTQGLVKSSDGGNSWQVVNINSGQVVMHIAYDRNNSQVVYAVDLGLGLHKTTDGGTTWRKVRQLNG